MYLAPLFAELEAVFSGSLEIEGHVRAALREARLEGEPCAAPTPLPRAFVDVMERADAVPICALIAQMPFDWAPPQTSSAPLYVEHSRAKVHVELLGPDGLIRSDRVRLGLYGMMPHAEYGIRTHPAEEIYIMLAGEVDWIRGDAPYVAHMPGERSYHPSMMPHASRTRDAAFLSVYAWHGDLSVSEYVYAGLPAR
ncbi:MAG: dimethylsulfonioproprionate lyase family protein [Aestuariivita sp.]|uniref:dimethylsulfonioproprionate lyase family protein n=1 Tax=Aestuariivita sp. TaxID=1872407 RepID=UPI003BAF8B9C